MLNVYHTDKFSEPLDDAYQMEFVYRVSKLQPVYFDISLTAHEGPDHTKNHQLVLETIPIDKNITFIDLRYSFDYSALGYFLMTIFGDTKIGFSIIDRHSDGNPFYVEGLRGLVERDVVRHCLAIVAYFDLLKTRPDRRFERRFSQLYDFTTRFKKQFSEMKKEEYLKYKNKDR